MSPVSNSEWLDVYSGNDLYVNATLIEGVDGSIPGTLLGAAQSEVGETALRPDLSNDGTLSVWYRWTAPYSGTFFFELTHADNVDMALDMVVGSTTAADGTLEAASENRTHNDPTPRMAARVLSSMEYYIRVSSTADEVEFFFSWGPTVVPVNCEESSPLELLADIDLTGTTYDGLSQDSWPTAWYKYKNRQSNSMEINLTPTALFPEENTFIVIPPEGKINTGDSIAESIFVDHFDGMTEVYYPFPDRDGWIRTGEDGVQLYTNNSYTPPYSGLSFAGAWNIFTPLSANLWPLGVQIPNGTWQKTFDHIDHIVTTDNSVQFNGHSTKKISGFNSTDQNSTAVALVSNFFAGASTQEELDALASCTPGKAYRVRAWVKGTPNIVGPAGGLNIGATLVFRATNGFAAGGGFGAPFVKWVDEEWGLIESAWECPVGGSKLDVAITVSSGDYTPDDYVWIGEISVDEVALPLDQIRPSHPVVQDIDTTHYRITTVPWDNVGGETGTALRVQDAENYLIVDGLGINSVIDGEVTSLYSWTTPPDLTLDDWLPFVVEDDGETITTTHNGVLLGTYETSLFTGNTLVGLGTRDPSMAFWLDYQLEAIHPASMVVSILPGESIVFGVTDLASDGSMGAFGYEFTATPLGSLSPCDVEGWWNCEYIYRKKLEITGPEGGLASSHPATVILPKTDTIEQGKIRIDLADIEVVYTDGESFYLLEKTIESDLTSVTLTFPLLFGLDEGDISLGEYYVYYGNPGLENVPGIFDEGYVPTEWPAELSLLANFSYTMPGDDWKISAHQASSTTVGAKITAVLYAEKLRIRANTSRFAGIVEIHIDDDIFFVDLFNMVPEYDVEIFAIDDLDTSQHTVRIIVGNEHHPSSVGNLVEITGIDLWKLSQAEVVVEEIIPLRWTSAVGGLH